MKSQQASLERRQIPDAINLYAREDASPKDDGRTLPVRAPSINARAEILVSVKQVWHQPLTYVLQQAAAQEAEGVIHADILVFFHGAEV